MVRVFIGVGSNIDPANNVQRGILLLSRFVGVRGISTFYLTAPVERPGRGAFYNGVVEVETDIPPERLKESVLQVVERELGRVRTADKYAPRPIDLDILIYDSLVESIDPEIRDRPFLAIPLCELDPDLVLPGSGIKIKEIAASLSNNGMRPLYEYTERLRREVSDEPRES